MATIYDTFNFPLNNIRLETPFNKSGVYFIKMQVANSPIYIQPPKCLIKQGFVKSGKKIFCDLVFSIEDNTFLSLLENIEEVAKNQIYENRTKWFETELDEHDIENSLTSAYKMYKSGKLYVIRANIPDTLGKSDLKIYDENENEILYENLKEDTNVITILELKGIKCSVRSFQFDFYIRQMLVVSPVEIFQKCIIRKQHPIHETTTAKQSVSDVQTPSIENDKFTTETYIDQSHSSTNADEIATTTEQAETTRRLLEETFESSEQPSLTEKIQTSLEMYATENDEKNIMHADATREDTKTQSYDPPPSFVDEICEIDLNLDKMENVETFHLKKRNDIYYKLYKEAKMKAKEAKMVALSNYLEAKRIKNAYSLDDSSDDESENDLEEVIA